MPNLTRRQFVGAASAAIASTLVPSLNAAPARRPNVLFIPVDDLRPQLRCYGQAQMISPNIDALAASGVLFERAYCQQAVCAPSRASFLTGCRPDTTKIYDLNTPMRTVMPDAVSLPQLFKQAGYHTLGMGKIYHHPNDDPQGWSEKLWNAENAFPGHRSKENIELNARLRQEAKAAGKDASKVRGAPTEAGDVADDAYADGAVASRCIAKLRELKDKPFFMAAGFVKPHLPFTAPKKYWDMFDRDSIKLPANPAAPKDVPPIAMHTWGELRAYHGIPAKGPLSEDQAKLLIHGYYASVAYVDAQIGRVIRELDNLGLRENTVIVLWGDHGWSLGEHGLWCKHSNFEDATHSPLILSAPGLAGNQRTRALVEFVDVYPTLAELCGLGKPGHLEGTSLVPLMKQPDRPWKTAAFSQYPRGKVMGRSMRTDRYRFTRWIDPQNNVVGTELYDHQADPRENVNLAGRPESAALVAELAAQLKAGWKAALPRT